MSGEERPEDIFDRLMALWQEPWSELAFGEAQMLVDRLRQAIRAAPYTPEPSEKRRTRSSGWSIAYGFVRCPLCREHSPVEDMVGGVCLTCADAIAFAQNARRGAVIGAAPSTEPALDVERLANAMSDAYTYEKDEYEPDLPFVDDIDGFWDPFAATVLARLAESQP